MTMEDAMAKTNTESDTSKADEVPKKERPSNKQDELEKHKKTPTSRLATKEDVKRAAANFKTLFDNFYK